MLGGGLIPHRRVNWPAANFEMGSSGLLVARSSKFAARQHYCVTVNPAIVIVTGFGWADVVP